MHHIPRFFIYRKKIKEMDSKQKPRKPRLERRNALKNIDYDAESSSSPPLDCASPLLTRSLDLSDRTSFRIEGIEGEFDRICRSLGLSGPDDFAIPTAAWETRKIRSSSSDIFPRSRLSCLDSPNTEDLEEGQMVDGLSNNFLDKAKAKMNTVMESVQSQPEPARWSGDGRRGGINGVRPPVLAPPPAMLLPKPEELEEGQMVDGLSNNLLDKVKLNTVIEPVQSQHEPARWSSGSGRGGIKGVRPPVLAPPPAMSLPVIDNVTSTWDIFRAFAPDGDTSTSVLIHEGSSSDEDHVHEDIEGGEVNGVRVGETSVLSESCSFTTSNDDDSSSTTTEPTNISPNGRFRRSITYWERGELLGRGSFGSVYEGIAEDGFFFAVKEVSLIDQGTLAEQSVFQLEQEIALLSQFEHENIVQYYGTDKDESKLYIFLELVTKGSLANLYKKYHLRDSQVSAYTRQILHGLKYLHDRNVVHRDIKCANILVDANGFVKLADFGLAKATKLNDVKSCKGTAFWMAPEVVRSHGYGLPADIWSLGCTVLEMLTSQLPYSDLECMQALFRIGRGIPPLVPDTLSIDAQDLILQCLRVNPNDRPTAAQLLDHPFLKRPLPSSSVPASPHNFIRRL